MINLFYKIRFYFLGAKKSVEYPDCPNDMITILGYDFSGDLFRLFNKYYSEGREALAGKDRAIPQLSCIRKQNGILVLSTHVNHNPENKNEFPFVCGRLSSKGNFEQLYGKFELVCKIPKSEGLYWPAFWLYSKNWLPEVDVFEAMKPEYHEETKTVTATFHYLQNGIHKQIEQRLSTRVDLSKDFHKFGLLWEKEKKVWYIDNMPIYILRGKSPTEPMHIEINTSIAEGVTTKELGNKIGEMEVKSLFIHKLL